MVVKCLTMCGVEWSEVGLIRLGGPLESLPLFLKDNKNTITKLQQYTLTVVLVLMSSLGEILLDCLNLKKPLAAPS